MIPRSNLPTRNSDSASFVRVRPNSRGLLLAAAGNHARVVFQPHGGHFCVGGLKHSQERGEGGASCNPTRRTEAPKARTCAGRRLPVKAEKKFRSCATESHAQHSQPMLLLFIDALHMSACSTETRGAVVPPPESDVVALRTVAQKHGRRLMLSVMTAEYVLPLLNQLVRPHLAPYLVHLRAPSHHPSLTP